MASLAAFGCKSYTYTHIAVWATATVIVVLKTCHQNYGMVQFIFTEDDVSIIHYRIWESRWICQSHSTLWFKFTTSY